MQWATANESGRASAVVSHNPNYDVKEDFEESSFSEEQRTEEKLKRIKNIMLI